MLLTANLGSEHTQTKDAESSVNLCGCVRIALDLKILRLNHMVPSHYWPPVYVHVTQDMITSPYLWAPCHQPNLGPPHLRFGERERGQRPEVSSTSLSWRAAPSAKRAACQVQRTAVRTLDFWRNFPWKTVTLIWGTCHFPNHWTKEEELWHICITINVKHYKYT